MHKRVLTSIFGRINFSFERGAPRWSVECTIGHDGEWIMFEIDRYLLGRSEIAPLSRTLTVRRRLLSKVLITPIDPAHHCVARFTR
jgi:hypothetical protein